jgi:quinol monooxygenase YgiN
MPKCFFVVRASVTDPTKRAAFDDWYRQEHLPQAMAAFGAEKGWRFWSETDPAVHQATYQFADKAAVDRIVNSAKMKALIAEFDRVWPGIPRTREVFTLAEERDGS